MTHGHGFSALMADQVMMIFFGQLVDQFAAAHVRRERESVLGQKLQRAVDGRLGDAWLVAAGAFVYLRRGEVSFGMMQNMQDRHSLRRHAKAALVQLVGENRAVGHVFPYCEKLQ